MIKITFLGAAQTVTGSKYLVQTEESSILVDCGLFQGHKNLRLMNWERMPFKASEINAVLLTHAHLDHSGYLPILPREGFHGAIFCPESTYDLCRIILPDSAKLQEEDAAIANKKGYSKHKPALPLYTEEDVTKCYKFFCPVKWQKKMEVAKGIYAEFFPAGHILGAASIKLTIGEKVIVFSGDLGRTEDPLLFAPTPLREMGKVDAVIMESTYGDRYHAKGNLLEELEEVMNEAWKRGGTVVVPAFAIGRTQLVLYYLNKLIDEKRIHYKDIFLDGPMAVSATQVFCQHKELHKLSVDECGQLYRYVTIIRSQDESLGLASSEKPKIVISSSGMATGGRVLNYLEKLLPDEKSTVMLVGFQAGGTRGARLLAGEPFIRMRGIDVPVKAKVVYVDGLSAHADKDELLAWAGLPETDTRPKTFFVTHGEGHASETFAARLHLAFPESQVHIPQYAESFEL